ncbi:hypothetical protein F4859DRAFT_513750 [Xylaria cf. heliscus]|nr:hypothetical protein F4859DRAFT_513750 [Xylaria cf. heliscus]
MADSQSVNWTVINEMMAALTPEQRSQAEWRICNAGKVPREEFKSRHRVYVDDMILTLGSLSLIGATLILYQRAWAIYLVFGFSRDDEVITFVAS